MKFIEDELDDKELLLRFVKFIVNDCIELSSEKAYCQRNDWRKRAENVLKKIKDREILEKSNFSS